jgi:hypothetical protein
MAPSAISQSPPKCEPGVTAPSVDRRGCVRFLAGLLGVLSLHRSLAVREDLPPAAQLQNWLQHFGPSRLGDPAVLSWLGASYLASHPVERDPGRLSQLILGGSAAPVQSQLIAVISQDWSRHDVTVVEGWVLARTEARICAVVHLMDGRPG